MSLLQFIRQGVQDSMNQVNQLHSVTNDVQSQILSYPKLVAESWSGTDAVEFGNDVMRKLIPALVELMAAFAGVNLNLTKATSIVDTADSKVTGLAKGLGDLFGAI